MLYETGMNALLSDARLFHAMLARRASNRPDARLNALQEFRHQNSAPNEDVEWNEILRDLVVLFLLYSKTVECSVLKHSLEAVHGIQISQQGFDPLAFRAPGPSREESGASPRWAQT